jgi:surfactin synthase thioesterase subunit
MTHTVVFSHGKDGDPWGNKIVALAEVARARSLHVESVDYRHIDDPTARVAKLLEFSRPLAGPLIFVGSSLGGHVSAAVAQTISVAGLFLLAPAFYMQGFEQYTPRPVRCPVFIVHGWRDDIVPVENSFRWSREAAATLHVIDGDHRLNENIPELKELFALFLGRVTAAENNHA